MPGDISKQNDAIVLDAIRAVSKTHSVIIIHSSAWMLEILIVRSLHKGDPLTSQWGQGKYTQHLNVKGAICGIDAVYHTFHIWRCAYDRYLPASFNPWQWCALVCQCHFLKRIGWQKLELTLTESTVQWLGSCTNTRYQPAISSWFCQRMLQNLKYTNPFV